MEEICLYGSKPSKYFKVTYAILVFIIIFSSTVDVIFFGGNHIQYYIVAASLLFANYIATVSQKYSFYLSDELLIVRNEYLFYENVKFSIHLGNIRNLDFRFAHSPKLPTIHITIRTSSQMKKIHIDDKKESLENLLGMLKMNGVNISFSNVQTLEDKTFVNKNSNVPH
jgi:hypothetical protein